MDQNVKSSEVVFLLGAGASVAAGVPDTYSFVKEFTENIEERTEKETIEKIIQTLEAWKKSNVDVELLLETLVKLKDKKQEPLMQFYDGGNFILKGYDEKKPLIDELKDFIKSKAIVSEQKIQYLQSFLGFVEDFRPLDIISLNYDTCIEQLCNVNKLSYQDGFDVYWNPKTFTAEHTDVRHYKLHGSVMWYQSNRGGYIKLPVMTERSKVKLITGETAENLMLYPMQKWDFAEPLLELLVEIKHLLESEACKFLIIVGYSFRDEHIRRILWDAARKNKDLHIILIDPKAHQIYSEKLKYYDISKEIPSSLHGKVICLPYKFEGVFSYIKNYYLINLKKGLRNETTQHKEELQGGKANWSPIIRHFIWAEYTEKAETLWEKIDSSELLEGDWQLIIEYHLKMAVNHLLNNQKRKASELIRAFNKFLYIIMVERIYANVDRGELPVIEVNFNYRIRDGHNYSDGVNNYLNFITTLYDFCESRKRLVDLNDSNKLQEIVKILKELRLYLKSLDVDGYGKINVEDYIQLRRDKISEINKFKNTFKFKDPSSHKTEKLASMVSDIERNILKEIIKVE